MLEQDESNIILNQVTFSDITALCNDSVFKEFRWLKITVIVYFI